jgi:hypothetical protein
LSLPNSLGTVSPSMCQNPPTRISILAETTKIEKRR